MAALTALNRAHLCRVHRILAVKAICGYRTVSSGGVRFSRIPLWDLKAEVSV